MDVNFLAVGAAAVLAVLLAGVWYSPWFFQRAHNARHRQAVGVYLASGIFAFVTALAFALLLGPQPELGPAIQLGLIISLGFIAMSIGISHGFESRPMRKVLVDGGYHVCQFVLYGIVLGVWH